MVEYRENEDVQGTFQKITLERLPIVVQDSISNSMLKDAVYLALNAKAYHMIDYFLEGMLVQLRTHVLAKNVDEVSRTISHPLDWWQAFKERWFPRWAKRRWPVRSRKETITLKRYVTFPDCRVCYPKEWRPEKIVVQMLESNEKEETD